MQETINAVGSLIDLCLQRGTFKTKQEAAEAINLHTKLQQEYNSLSGEHALAVKMLEEANAPKQAKPNPIPKQNQLNPVEDKK